MKNKKPAKKRNKAVFNIYLEPAQLTKLRAMSDKTGAPIAALVRKAVDKFLNAA